MGEIQQMEDDADDLILEDEDVDYFIPGALAGDYWLSGEPPVRTREDLLLVEGDWSLSRHGWKQDIAEYATIMHVFDVETTGLKPDEGARAIEVATVLVGVKTDGTVYRVLDPFGLDAIGICAAHNSKFDSAFLPMLSDRQWIDTLRCAKHVWPV
jgi:DNA polymerase III epsilon subunit-like protein